MSVVKSRRNIILHVFVIYYYTTQQIWSFLEFHIVMIGGWMGRWLLKEVVIWVIDTHTHTRPCDDMVSAAAVFK